MLFSHDAGERHEISRLDIILLFIAQGGFTVYVQSQEDIKRTKKDAAYAVGCMAREECSLEEAAVPQQTVGKETLS